MLLGILAVMAITLIGVMFATRNLMLGFPSAIFWAILGGHSYLESTATWDIYYLIFFASMGMAIFSMYAMYGLRPKDLSGPDADEGKYFDEVKEPDLRGNIDKEKESTRYIDEPNPSKLSKRTQGIRDRAARRRSS